jgi:tRNA pseudouridine38-40 synthase
LFRAKKRFVPEVRVKNIRMEIAYDGTDFCGYQVQPDGRTVQGDIEKALTRMHGHPVRICSAGRTDSGVHAVGQVINFYSDLESVTEDNWARALNSYLPKDIKAQSASVAADGFHARFDAIQRTYRYYFYPSPYDHPFLYRQSWRIRFQPDLKLLNSMASVIIGEHDFTSFTLPSEQSKTKVRTVKAASFLYEGPLIVFEISAGSFLWRMVRSLAGTMMTLNKDGGSVEQFRAFLLAKERTRAIVSAPPQGLFLYKVHYECERQFTHSII